MISYIVVIGIILLLLGRRKICNNIENKHDHAIIIGGSIAGMTSAAYLSKYFRRITIIESDDVLNEILINCTPGQLLDYRCNLRNSNSLGRSGVTENFQIHVLQGEGRKILFELFPNLENKLINEYGAYLASSKRHFRVLIGDVLLNRNLTEDLSWFCIDRFTVETVLRREFLLQFHPTQIQWITNTKVKDLIVSPSNHGSRTTRRGLFVARTICRKDNSSYGQFVAHKISTARCFLNTKPWGFFDISSDDPSVVQLQTRLSFKTTDNRIVVLAGIHEYLRYLRESFSALVNKTESKRKNSNHSTTNDLVHQVPSSSFQTAAFSNSSASVNPSNDEQQTNLKQQIALWWEKNRDQYDLGNAALTELEDYQITISDQMAVIQCCCNKRISLPKLRGRKTYQLSNFYKHLTRKGRCNAI
ncbi:unnamed protein product [Adineta ricciae]|uniref:Uncharacterized protein n=1 Tax=Adineta ricciae TaxID=249248 RepID=A0A815VKG1_ADIRI|nr:unnamed protein product [Adineta ricciae]